MEFGVLKLRIPKMYCLSVAFVYYYYYYYYYFIILLFFLGEMVASVQKTPTWSIVVHNDESQCLIFK